MISSTILTESQNNTYPSAQKENVGTSPNKHSVDKSYFREITNQQSTKSANLSHSDIKIHDLKNITANSNNFTNEYQNSLEFNYSHKVISKVKTNKPNRFDSFLQPNEHSPQNMEKHLKLAKEGEYVSTGTERCFYAILFGICTGMIIIDINPKVKAYNDMNILLLRLSKTPEEYLCLSKKPKNLQERINLIKGKINDDIELSQEMRNYYLKNLQKFAPIYYENQEWRDDYEDDWDDLDKPNGFKGPDYRKDRASFFKLHELAKKGQIISIEGSINHLSFLKGRNITVVDTSNILQYSFVNPKFDGDLNPRILFTHFPQLPDDAKYYSYKYSKLSSDEENEFNEVVKTIALDKLKLNHGNDELIAELNENSIPELGEDLKIRPICDIINFVAGYQNLETTDINEFDCQVGAHYTPKVLSLLKAYR